MPDSEREPDGAASNSEGLLYAGMGMLVAFIVVLVVGLSIAVAGLTESKPGSAGTASAGGPADGAALYDQHCATCHGDQGEGRVGPALHGVAETYPDIEGQMLLVEQGRGAMPSFRSTLTEDEIRAVVEFERATFLGDDEVAAEE